MNTIKHSGYVYSWLYGVALSCKNVDQVGTADRLVEIALKNKAVSEAQGKAVMQILRGKIDGGR